MLSTAMLQSNCESDKKLFYSQLTFRYFFERREKMMREKNTQNMLTRLKQLKIFFE